MFKGKKMPGRMGGKGVTMKNLLVRFVPPRCSPGFILVMCRSSVDQLFKVDPKNNLLYVRGSVPGRNGSWVR